MYWYSMPPLLKLWLDEVFLSGFAYGKGEMALRGKTMQISMTTGGGPEAYTPQGFHGHHFEEFLYPWKQTAKLMEMKFAEPIVLHAAVRSNDDELLIHAEKVRDRVMAYTLPGYDSKSLGSP
jgi:glutathione-regulated potassium-efflux system ancillary protein KefF